ncbi:MAG TPA: amino acid ABC transporter substrate-binding protein [Chloroflexota bacterium]|nr:amino acid ABC transporter substrate-binding protein [Chloroflexota bacterium]
MTRPHHQVVRIVFGIAVAALTAACGVAGTGQPEPGGRAEQQVASPARSLPIGTALSLSGRFSREGSMLRAGYETWLEAVNSDGGVVVGGQKLPVRLVVYDDESEPLTAIKMVERLVHQDGVGLILGPFSSQTTLSSATVAERLGALTVAPDASLPGLYSRGLQMIVSVLPTDDRYFCGLVELAGGLSPRPRPIALLVPDEPFYTAAVEGARERARALGMDAPLVESYPPNARDVLGPLSRIAAARPRLLAVGGPPERLAGLRDQLQELRLAPPLRALGPGQATPELRRALQSDLDGAIVLDWWFPELTASGPVLGSAREFRARFERLHGYPPDSRAAAAAAAGLALQLGVERAASVDPRAVRAALGQVDVLTFWGHLGWDSAGRNRATIPPLVQYQGSRPVAVYPPDFAGGQLRYPP